MNSEAVEEVTGEVVSAAQPSTVSWMEIRFEFDDEDEDDAS